jgi:hypothetical protein
MLFVVYTRAIRQLFFIKLDISKAFFLFELALPSRCLEGPGFWPKVEGLGCGHLGYIIV